MTNIIKDTDLSMQQNDMLLDYIKNGMTIIQLENIFSILNFKEIYAGYSLYEEEEGRLCLCKEDNKWHIFHFERGQRNYFYDLLEDENTACLAFFYELLTCLSIEVAVGRSYELSLVARAFIQLSGLCFKEYRIE